jgi:hypothetical protein
MTGADIWNFVVNALAFIGGIGTIGLIAGGVAKFFADRSNERFKAQLGQEAERLKAELGKDAETHKWKLKRKELLFEKEYAAASEFFELHRKLEPRYSHPDKEWHEALDDVIDDFTKSHDLLRKYISKHGPVLRPKNREELDRCQQLAENHQYAKHDGDIKGAETAAEEFLEKLKNTERRFAVEIRKG